MKRGIAVLLLLGAMAFGVWAGAGRAAAQPQVKFVVTGTAPKGAAVRYGSFNGEYPGRFPLHAKMALISDENYYFLSARLKGGGKITCKLTIGKFTKVGHAKGKHKTCAVSLTNNYKGGWY